MPISFPSRRLIYSYDLTRFIATRTFGVSFNTISIPHSFSLAFAHSILIFILYALLRACLFHSEIYSFLVLLLSPFFYFLPRSQIFIPPSSARVFFLVESLFIISNPTLAAIPKPPQR